MTTLLDLIAERETTTAQTAARLSGALRKWMGPARPNDIWRSA
ncbi:hypothetical protein [Actinoplanes sp. L3-i22]|nr:hypothetical protein [Actinoplanes sp. L3-i22]